MRFIRHQMRQHREVDLTVLQFRALVFLNFHDGHSLSAMAEHLGLSLPATSRMVELLVQRGLMERRTPSRDRRRVALSLTRRGKQTFRKARAATQIALARGLQKLSPQALGQVAAAMQTLSRVFAPENSHPGPDR